MHVEFYTKPACSICNDARALVEDAQDAWGFSLTDCNILRHEPWFERYRYRVPVVVIDGTEALELRFDAAALEAALRQAADRTKEQP